MAEAAEPCADDLIRHYDFHALLAELAKILLLDINLSTISFSSNILWLRVLIIKLVIRRKAACLEIVICLSLQNFVDFTRNIE